LTFGGLAVTLLFSRRVYDLPISGFAPLLAMEVRIAVASQAKPVRVLLKIPFATLR
jgi:hypothetical protein